MQVIATRAARTTAKSKRHIMVNKGKILTVDWDGVECFSTKEYGMGTFFAKDGFTPIECCSVPKMDIKFADSVKPAEPLPPGTHTVTIDSVNIEQVGDASVTDLKGVKINFNLQLPKAKPTLEELSQEKLWAGLYGGGLATKVPNYLLPAHLKYNAKHITILHTEEEIMTTSGAALFLAVSTVFTTVECKFRDANQKTYTYKAKLDDEIMVGDVVVVDTPSSGFTIVDVVAVHAQPKLMQGINYKWIVQRVDNTEYKKQLQVEAELSSAIEKEADANSRKRAAKALKKAYPDGSEVRSILEKYVL